MISRPASHLRKLSLDWIGKFAELGIKVLCREPAAVSDFCEENEVHVVVYISKFEVRILFFKHLEFRDEFFDENGFRKFESQISLALYRNKNRSIFLHYSLNLFSFDDLLDSGVKDEWLELS